MILIDVNNFSLFSSTDNISIKISYPSFTINVTQILPFNSKNILWIILYKLLLSSPSNQLFRNEAKIFQTLIPFQCLIQFVTK